MEKYDKRYKIPILPQSLSPELAEFIGILAGDGHLAKVKHEINITGGSQYDKDYVQSYIYRLFKNLFGIEPRIEIMKNKNVIRCRTYSKIVSQYLTRIYGHPIGKKKGRLNIPKQILDDSEMLKCYLRGVFDTDGSFHRHHKKSASVEFISVDLEFLNQINLALKGFGFSTSKTGKSVHIYSREHIDRFFAIIKPANPKNILKYRIYKDTGMVPRNLELSADSLVVQLH